MDGPEIQCECQMCELEAAGYGPEAYAEIIMGHIGRVGWAVQGIPGDEQCPSWAYSIGLRHTYGMPELAMFGLSRIPRLTMTVGYDPRFTSGHFGVFVATTPEKADEAEAVLRKHGAEVRRER